ncbi:DUF4330 domain-containing protein [Caldicellulosiruptoraceae bacterium PP1]
MKIIDEKGRLFKVINLFDLIIIVLVLSITIAGIIKFSKHSPTEQNNLQSNINVKIVPGEALINVKIPLTLPEYAKALKVNDKLVSGDNFTNSYIKDIRIEKGQYITTNQDGKIIVNTHPQKVDVYLTLYGYVTFNGATIKLDKQTVRIGKSIFIKTNTVELNGTINGIQIIKKND